MGGMCHRTSPSAQVKRRRVGYQIIVKIYLLAASGRGHELLPVQTEGWLPNFLSKFPLAKEEENAARATKLVVTPGLHNFGSDCTTFTLSNQSHRRAVSLGSSETCTLGLCQLYNVEWWRYTELTRNLVGSEQIMLYR